MKIFGIMLVKNEVDIVGHVLKEAEKWADKIFILDNGSTDGTWELVNSMANDIITPWKQYFGEYHNGLRADVYNEFKHLSQPGDWWCYKLDADEFYIDNPKEFLKKYGKNCQWIAKQSLDFFITKEDKEEYTYTGDFEKDKAYVNYFCPICWSEGRFFKYRKNLKWENTWNSHYPPHIGIMSKKLILVEHYRQRSPQQAEKRNTLRKQTDNYKKGVSWSNQDNEYYSREDLIFYDKNYEKIRLLQIDSGNFKRNIIKNFLIRLLLLLGLYK